MAFLKNKIYRRVLKALLFTGVLVLAYFFVDFGEFLSALKKTSPGWIFILIFIATLDRVLMGIKWAQMGFPLGASLKSYYAASFVNYLLPTTLGGEIVRGHQMIKATGEKERVLASMVIERVIGILSTLFLSALGLYALREIWTDPRKQTLAIGALVFSTVAAGLLLFLCHPASQKFFARITPKLAARFEQAFSRYQGAPGLLFFNFILAVLENGTQIFLAYAAALALHVNAPALAFLAIFAVITLVRRVSMIFDSWGVSEALTVGMLALIHIEPSTGLAISLMRHVAIAGASLPGFFFLDKSFQAEDALRAKS